MADSKFYKMKHLPTGLYYQPHLHRGSHLSKKGKIYQTDTNGVETGSYRRKKFEVLCRKESRIHKLTKDILNWEQSSNYMQLKAQTEFNDWVREYI